MQTKRSAYLILEVLEDRLVPDATIAVASGNLIIKGTGAAEAIQIDGSGSDIVVTALDGTTFNNGQTQARFARVTGIVAHLGGGADALAIKNLTLTKHVEVDTGAGGDHLTLTNVNLHGKSDWNLGQGDDSVSLEGVTALAQSDWRLGQGADHPVLLHVPETFYLKGLLLDVMAGQ